MSFVFPNEQLPFWLLVGVAIAAAVAAGLAVLERGRQLRLARFAESSLAPRLMDGFDLRLRGPLTWLTVAGVAGLLAALSQPRWGESWHQLERGSRDVMVLLDTSESMNAANPMPSRLSRAGRKIEAMLERLPGDRFGLIAFSGGAALVCPLTLDHAYLRSVLSAISTNTLSEEGTDIAEAFQEAIRAFEEDAQGQEPVAAGSQAVLLLTDGEAVSGDAREAARRLSNYASIMVMGIGDETGASVRPPEWYIRQYQDPAPHQTRLDEANLTAIAQASGGVYVRTTPNNVDVDALAEQMEAMSARELSSELRFRRVNRYRWPLVLALLAFAGEALWLYVLPILRRNPKWLPVGARLGHA